MTISTETRALIEAALAGDPALASLAVAGSSSETLTVHVGPGVPAKSVGGSSYSPEPPFRRETLAELVVRMQRLRWQRAAPLTPLAMPPEDRDLQALHEKHPRATVGFECGPGWTDLFDATFTWLHEIAPNTDWTPSQIKEKYGTLRFYWHGNLPDLGAEIIDAAEHARCAGERRRVVVDALPRAPDLEPVMTILTRDIVAAGLREAARVAAGFVPGEAELAGAPLLSNWAVEAQPGDAVRLVGVVTGHPSIGDGWCTTSVVLAADTNAGWARTVSRYYRLGPKLGEVWQ